LLERQAAYLGFLDCFTALGWFVLLGVPLVFYDQEIYAAIVIGRALRAGFPESSRNE